MWDSAVVWKECVLDGAVVSKVCTEVLFFVRFPVCFGKHGLIFSELHYPFALNRNNIPEELSMSSLVMAIL